MFLIILKNGLNKYSKLIWILVCVLVIIIISVYIENNKRSVVRLLIL
ncbi:DUF2606 family protein [Bacillus toyonensis]|nr:DUF2606 family protein [Bacillus toyonensis]